MTETPADRREQTRQQEKRRLRVEGKRTQRVVTWVDADLELDLMRHAAAEDRSVGDLVRLILMRHMYGIVRLDAEPDHGKDRPE